MQVKSFGPQLVTQIVMNLVVLFKLKSGFKNMKAFNIEVIFVWVKYTKPSKQKPFSRKKKKKKKKTFLGFVIKIAYQKADL